MAKKIEHLKNKNKQIKTTDLCFFFEVSVNFISPFVDGQLYFLVV